MTPTVFLVILCLGVASAAILPDTTLYAELQEQKGKEGFRKAVWDEFMKTVKLYNSKSDQEEEELDIEMSALSELTDEDFMKIMTSISHSMSGEDENQAQSLGDVPEFEDLVESGDEIPIQEQLE
ncbi:trophoblast specific protein alpha [Rattus norvegicus]|uniref:Spongiotrophoblast specific protein n=2 Tax=Rattus norvegicus TaxID=10116 RepID=F7EWR8_RAT|nr:trophoblast specific protein alpha precursor [Rattus norvegicus]EDL93856.1 trophoblast specific protein alpha [Rattus norvegicus]BAA32481.1 spongiotrophoblast specific protein [Rattus norvegicus]|eukprot:NP_742070.1 trophoblast specific protein alpha precursor [Rattus norvegicus]